MQISSLKLYRSMQCVACVCDFKVRNLIVRCDLKQNHFTMGSCSTPGSTSWASASRYCRLFRLLGTRVHKRRDAVSLNARLKSALAHAPESQRGAPSHVRGCPCAAGNLLAATCTWTAIVVRRFFGRALTFVGFVLEVPSPRAILSERRS